MEIPDDLLDESHGRNVQVLVQGVSEPSSLDSMA